MASQVQTAPYLTLPHNPVASVRIYSTEKIPAGEILLEAALLRPSDTQRSDMLVVLGLFTRVTDVLGCLDLGNHLAQVVALGSLQRREFYVRFQVLQPKLLADRIFQSYWK